MEKKSAHNRRPDGDAIRGQLFEGHFGVAAKDDQALPLSDPISITQLVLKLNEIKPYDKNPRRMLNPEYESIKASIRSQRGLNNPFNVTRRPGDDKYMVQSGGNTRLAILKELYAETGDDIFNTLHCLFVPWSNESNVLTAHFIENEMRGDMALIDKAYGIQELRAQLEQELGDTLSDRAFAKTMSEKGFKLSDRQVRRLNYALDLDLVIPTAIREGMTTRELDTIKNTEEAYLQYCKDKIQQMPALFAHIMSQHDGEYFDLECVRNAIERELSQLIDVPSNKIAMEIDAMVFERTANKRRNTSFEELFSESPEPEYAKDTHDDSDEENQSLPLLAQRQLTANETDRNRNPIKSQAPKLPKENGKNAKGHVIHDIEEQEQQAIPLTERYAQGYALAAKIAKAVALEMCVLQRSGGMGFVVERPDIKPQNFSEWGIWWMLIGIAEQSEPDNVHLWDETELYNMYVIESETGDAELVRNHLSDPPNMMMFPHQLLNDSTLLSDGVLNDLFKLIGNCRAIRAQCAMNDH